METETTINEKPDLVQVNPSPETSKVEQDEPAVSKLDRIRLWMFFYTDCDFSVNLDGLDSFINSRLGEDMAKYRFRSKDHLVDELRDYPLQLISLEVSLPQVIVAGKPVRPAIKMDEYQRASWAKDAIDEVLYPAAMWVFAEMGIGCRHKVSGFFDPGLFTMFGWERQYDLRKFPLKALEDGVAYLPKYDTMGGNYDNSWAQWEFSSGLGQKEVEDLTGQYTKDVYEREVTHGGWL